VLAPLLARPYEVIRARHVGDHAELFDRCWLQLGHGQRDGVPTDERLRALRDGNGDEGLCALLFHYGRYLLMASSRPGTEPANLQGSGTTKYAAMELQLDDKYQHRNELLAGRDDQPGRVP